MPYLKISVGMEELCFKAASHLQAIKFNSHANKSDVSKYNNLTGMKRVKSSYQIMPLKYEYITKRKSNIETLITDTML